MKPDFYEFVLTFEELNNDLCFLFISTAALELKKPFGTLSITCSAHEIISRQKKNTNRQRNYSQDFSWLTASERGKRLKHPIASDCFNVAHKEQC